VDIAIMVVRFGFTQSQSVVRAIRHLRVAQVRWIGLLVNAMDPRSREYYHYSGSYGYEGYPYADVQVLAPGSSKHRPKGERT